MADSTVIWLFQPHASAGQTRVIDVIKGEGVGLDWYVQRARGGARAARLGRRPGCGATISCRTTWRCARWAPARAGSRRCASSASRATICPNLPVEDGIQAVRALIPRCWFDRTRCAKGLEALRMYRRDYDERREEYRVMPLHDWTSHYADAFRYFAVGYRPARRDAAEQAGYAVGGLRGGVAIDFGRL